METMLFTLPNQYRIGPDFSLGGKPCNNPILKGLQHLVTNDNEIGLGGFVLPLQGKPVGFGYLAWASSGFGWEHVSVTVLYQNNRCPTWEEMCYIKSLFWDPEAAVMQLHPPRSQWVNNHPYCLHLWRPLNEAIPLPHPLMVGAKQGNVQVNKTR